MSAGRVIVTRPADQSEELCALLAAAGFEPVSYATIAVEPLDDLSALDGALRRLPTYRCIVFTSANAARIVCQRANRLGIGPASWLDAQIVAGPQTAAALAAHGVSATIVPQRFSASAVLDTLASHPLAGQRVLVPRAEQGLDTITDGLRARGALVHEVAIYRTIPIAESPALVRALRERRTRAIVFFSPSAVAGFANALVAAEERPEVARNISVACIGETTAAAARAAGLRVALVPSETTATALVRHLREALTREAMGASS